MPDDVRAMLDELERLEKAATPGPWEGSGRKIGYRWGYAPRVIAEVDFYEEYDMAIAVAARNALPTLLRLARRAGEMEAVVVAARKFVSDGPTQASGANLMSMSAALAALKEPTND